MHYAAAAIMIAIYMYNLPLMFALVWREEGVSAGISVVEARFAVNSALRRMGRNNGSINRRKKRDISTALKLLRQMRIEYFSLRMQVGTGDAAKTALLCGLIRSLGCVMLAASENGSVDVRPEFSCAALRGEGSLVLSAKLGRLAAAAAGMVNMG